MALDFICENHKKKFESFCRTHVEPLCVACISSRHKTCSDVIALETAAKNAKTSAALVDVEETIDETMRNIKYWIENRESASKSFEEQEHEIKTYIHNTRIKINERLDELTQSLIQELATKYKDCQTRNAKVLNYLKSTRKDLKKIKEQTFHLKELPADIQIFLGTHYAAKNIAGKTNEIKTEMKTAANYSIKIEISPEIKTLINDVCRFGRISVEEKSTKLSFKEVKANQAQIRVPNMQNVQDIKLQLKQKFQIKNEGIAMWISGCAILPNNNVLIADYYGKKQLMEYNNKGEHIRDIPVSNKPFDLTLVDDNRVAVSYGFTNYIRIINIRNNVVEKKIELGGNCKGISYQDGKLYVAVEDEGIVVVDTTGKQLNTIKCDYKVEYLTAAKDRLYTTDFYNHTVHCYNSTAKEIWVFQHDSVKCPQGLSIDNCQNVFVTGRYSYNLTIIQHDGKAFKTLLTRSDGLDQPEVVCLNMGMKELFIANNGNDNAAFYHII